jgi:hypothetical protein
MMDDPIESRPADASEHFKDDSRNMHSIHAQIESELRAQVCSLCPNSSKYVPDVAIKIINICL